MRELFIDISEWGPHLLDNLSKNKKEKRIIMCRLPQKKKRQSKQNVQVNNGTESDKAPKIESIIKLKLVS